MDEGAILQIFDPKVSLHQIALDLGQDSSSGESGWQQVPNALHAASGADAVVLLTEWQEFAQIDWKALAEVMRQPSWLFDARGKADAQAARAAGLQVWTVGEG
jgi:UDPglucose 6-dehydrogenase